MIFFVQMSNSNPLKAKGNKPNKFLNTLIEQVLNSAIVGGIAGLSALAAGGVSWKAAAIGFGITFLTEMRKYRKI